MIEVAVVDVTAESRSRLNDRIASFHTAAAASQTVVPQLSIRPLSLQELKFSSSLARLNRDRIHPKDLSKSPNNRRDKLLT